MATCHRACSVPLRSLGAISATYTGITEETIASPTPVMTREKIWAQYVGATPDRKMPPKVTAPL